MGCCCGKSGSEEEVIMPSAECRRRLQEAAAQKRLEECERRGLKDPQRFKHRQARAEELQRQDRAAAFPGTPVLKWQQD